MLLATTAGSASVADGGQPSPWDGPWKPSISAAEAERFVDLWAARVPDEAWFGPYLQSEVVPEDVLAEGFHGLDRHTKMYLVHRLFERLAVTLPDLAADLAGPLGKDKKSTDGQKNVLYLFIFDKTWVGSLRDKATIESKTENSFKPTAELSQKVSALKPVTPLERPTAAVPAGLRHPDAVTKNVDATPEVAGVPDLRPARAARLPRPDAAVVHTRQIDPTRNTSPLGLGTYIVCTASPTKARSCTGDVPLGVPANVDVNGDGTHDVAATLTLGTLALNALEVVFEARRLATSPALPGYVTASVESFQAQKRVEFGFESANVGSLPNTSTGRFRLNDIAAALAGNVSLTSGLTFSGGTAPAGIRVRSASLNYANLLAPTESSPTEGTVLFNPIPSSLTTDVTLNRLAGQDEYKVKLQSGVSPLTTAHFEVFDGPTASATRTRMIDATINTLPNNTEVSFSKLVTGDVVAKYTASSTIGSASVTDTTFTSPTSRRVTTVSATSIPASLQVTYSPPLKFAYSASSAMPSASITLQEYAGATLLKNLAGTILSLPTSVSVDASALLGSGGVSTAQYRASSPVGRVALNYAKNTGETFAASIDNIPTSIDATVDMGAQRLSWTASGPAGPLAAAAQNIPAAGRSWALGMNIASIPAQWDATFAAGHPVWRGISGPLSNVTGFITNHGSYTAFAFPHFSIVYDTVSGNLDGSFNVPAVTLIDIAKTATGFTSDLRIGGASSFVNALVGDATTRAAVRATVTPVPPRIQLTQVNEALSYSADANFDLVLDADVGNIGGIAAAPLPPLVHGASIRDGFGCVAGTCGNGIRARVFLRGFPTSFQVAPNHAGGPRIELGNFRPPAAANFLVADLDLDNVMSPRTRLVAVQSSIPTSGISMIVGPITTGSVSGGKQIKAEYRSSAAMGALFIDVERGTDVGRLTVSNIPASAAYPTTKAIDATVTLVDGTSTARLLLGQTIGNITASVRRTSDISFLAALSLGEIPTDVNLSFGRITVTSGSDSFTVPGLSYRANASTLDVSAFVSAALGGAVQGVVTLGITNLGATTDMFLQGNALRLNSSPATAAVEIHTWGRISYIRHFNFCVPGDCPTFRLRVSGHAGVVPLTINDLGVRVTNVSSLRVLLGLTSGIDGGYGTFQFGWSSMTVTLDVEVTVDACVSGWCATIVSYTNHSTFPLNVLFHLGTPHWALWWHAETPIPCSWTAAYDIHVDINPHPHFASWNGFTVSPPGGGEGNAWTVTPNPQGLLPGFAADAIAAVTSPYGGGFDISFPCH